MRETFYSTHVWCVQATDDDARPPAPQILWPKIKNVYSSATTGGAASSIANQPELLMSKAYSIQFVLRVADTLRSKPKAPKRSECDVSSLKYLAQATPIA